jgi:hypothetical protein
MVLQERESLTMVEDLRPLLMMLSPPIKIAEGLPLLL